MRIRRRPPISSALPPPSEIPDPSLFQLQPPNKGEETREKGVGGGGEGLHPVGDPPVELHGWVMDPINWDPSPSASHPVTERSKQAGREPPFFPPTLSQTQVLIKEVIIKEEEEEMVDFNKRWNAQANSNKRIGSSSSALVFEEMALLPKKRRGGDVDNGNGYGRREEMKPVGKEKTTTKSKVRAKASSTTHPVANDCTTTTVNGGENKRAEVVMMNGNVGSHGKKRRSPAVLMEGSRCSRVNGRGWRCCQQTLVGYSLCEHHLGKGRLRSMSGVRVQAGSSSTKPKKSTEGGADRAAPLSNSSPQEEEKAAFDVKQCSGVDHNGEEEEEEYKKKQIRKRRKKIGIVKARTISSLLDETNHSVQSPPPVLEPAPMQSIGEGATVV